TTRRSPRCARNGCRPQCPTTVCTHGCESRRRAIPGEAIGDGLTIVKFYPPHRGHHGLIRTMERRCARATVVVEAAEIESVPLADRVAWLRAVHPDVTGIGVHCDVPPAFGDA